MKKKPSIVARGKVIIRKKASRQGLLIFGLVFAVLGTVILLMTHAATPVTSIEASQGIPSGPVTSVANGSGGNAVQFGSTATTPTGVLHTCYPNAFCDSNNKPLQLNGVNEKSVGTYSASALCSDWPGIASHGFNVVRLAVDWPSVEPSQGTFNFTDLDDAINTAEANGLYVILDAIHMTTTGNDNLPTWTTGSNAIAKATAYGPAYWKALDARYGSDKKIIAYDLVNEPQQGGGTLDQNTSFSMYNAIINAVRSVDTSKILIMEPINGNSSLSGVNWSLITNKSNLVFSAHDYFAGGSTDGFGSNGYASGNYVYDGTSGYDSPSATTLAEMTAHIQDYVTWLQTPQLPLYMGEYGVGINATNNQLWISQTAGIFNQFNLPRTYWMGCGGTNLTLHPAGGSWVSYTGLTAY